MWLKTCKNTLYNNNNIEKTDGVIREEQCGFRKARGCTDQIFTVRQLCEKSIEKGKEVFCAFMDLEKAYDRVDRDALWQTLRLYGVGGRLLKAVKSLYVESRACVRVGNELSEWFPVNTGVAVSVQYVCGWGSKRSRGKYVWSKC